MIIKAETAGVIQTIAIDIFAVCGVVAIGLGLWQIYQPAAYIGVGVILLSGAILAGRGG